MFWFVGNEIGSFELYVRKSSDLVFPRKVRCFKLHNTKKFFGYLAPKLGSLSFISQKTAILLFCLLKHVALTQRKKVSFQFAASHPAFLLTLLKTTFFLVIG